MASKTEENSLETQAAIERAKKARQNAAARARAARGESGEGFMAGLQQDRNDERDELHRQHVVTTVRLLMDINYECNAPTVKKMGAQLIIAFSEAVNTIKPNDYAGRNIERDASAAAEAAIRAEFGNHLVNRHPRYVRGILSGCCEAVSRARTEVYSTSRSRGHLVYTA